VRVHSSGEVVVRPAGGGGGSLTVRLGEGALLLLAEPAGAGAEERAREVRADALPERWRRLLGYAAKVLRAVRATAPLVVFHSPRAAAVLRADGALAVDFACGARAAAPAPPPGGAPGDALRLTAAGENGSKGAAADELLAHARGCAARCSSAAAAARAAGHGAVALPVVLAHRDSAHARRGGAGQSTSGGGGGVRRALVLDGSAGGRSRSAGGAGGARVSWDGGAWARGRAPASEGSTLRLSLGPSEAPSQHAGDSFTHKDSPSALREPRGLGVAGAAAAACATGSPACGRGECSASEEQQRSRASTAAASARLGSSAAQDVSPGRSGASEAEGRSEPSSHSLSRIEHAEDTWNTALYAGSLCADPADSWAATPPAAPRGAPPPPPPPPPLAAEARVFEFEEGGAMPTVRRTAHVPGLGWVSALADGALWAQLDSGAQVVVAGDLAVLVDAAGRRCSLPVAGGALQPAGAVLPGGGAPEAALLWGAEQVVALRDVM
jgi:hypothetical protein